MLLQLSQSSKRADSPENFHRCLVVWPNITGDSDNGGESSHNYNPNGVFYSRIVAEGEAMSYRPENNTNIEVICLDATRVSSIYNGTKLQPSALQTLACIKT